MDRIMYAIRRRPVRVVEAALALAAALGFVFAPEVEDAIIGLLVAVVGVIGGEAAQTKTTPTADPHLEHEVDA